LLYAKLHHAIWYKFTNVSEVLAASITRAARSSEMLVNFYQTTGYNIPETVIFILAAMRT
jgi:hypothetical protein